MSVDDLINGKWDNNEIPVDPEGIAVDIDINDIDNKANDIAFALCKNLREVYFDDNFMKLNPRIKERLDAEIESIRVLIKMRKSDEQIHDLCVRAIGQNSNNASLYAALARIQTSLLNIQKQLDDTVKNINELLKNTQLELNFDNEDAETEEQHTTTPLGHSRGSKGFIEQMKAELEN